MTDRYVHALWCDDIRQEIGNKPSFMGVYINGMTVPSPPIMLHKLSVYVWAFTPKDKPFKTISIKIIRDDGFVLIEVPANNIETNLESLPLEPFHKRIQFMLGINLSGVEIPEGCKYFAIEVETESEILDGQKLIISRSILSCSSIINYGKPPVMPGEKGSG